MASIDNLKLVFHPLALDVHIVANPSAAGSSPSVPLARGGKVWMEPFDLPDVWPHDPVNLMDVLNAVAQRLMPVGLRLSYALDASDKGRCFKMISLEKRHGVLIGDKSEQCFEVKSPAERGNVWHWSAIVAPSSGQDETGHTAEGLEALKVADVRRIDFNFGEFGRS